MSGCRMNEFHFRGVTRIVLAWAPSMQGLRQRLCWKGLLLWGIIHRAGRRSKVAGATRATSLSHEARLNGCVNRVSGLPAQRMKGKHVSTSPRLPLATVGLAGIHRGCPVGRHQDVRPPTAGQQCVPHTTGLLAPAPSWSGSAWSWPLRSVWNEREVRPRAL